MSNIQFPHSAHGNRRLLLLPSVDNSMSPQTLAMAEALQQGGFEVDIADIETEAAKLLVKASEAQHPYPLVILGLGMSPTDGDLERVEQVSRLNPTAFIVACAAEYSDRWEAEARKHSQRGQIIR